MADDVKAEDQNKTAEEPNESVVEEASETEEASGTEATETEATETETESKATENGDSQAEEQEEEAEESKPNETSPTKSIPNKDETSNETVTSGNDEEAEEGIKLSVEEEHSDAELLVDESMEMEITSEINNSSDAEEKENDIEVDETTETKDKEKETEKKTDKETRSRKRSRSRSRSTERERLNRQQRLQDKHDTSSNSPYMIRSRIFVGHLDTDKVSKEDVRQLFAPYGKVVGVALHQGYGFVQYDNAESAKAAIKEAHGTPVAGMKIGEVDYHHVNYQCGRFDCVCVYKMPLSSVRVLY